VTGQIVEITSPDHWLGKWRGFLVVRNAGRKIGQVPLDDIAAVIVSTSGCGLSSNLIDQLAERNIPFVICGRNYLPACWTLPVAGYGRQFSIMRAQCGLKEPRRKRAWQRIVRAKIENQAEVLARTGAANSRLERLSRKVRSGDPENCEALAARIYWQSLFGSDFRRDRQAPGLNAALNYSYTILRACIARGVSGAGLHPSFSIHHRNPQNPFNLVDDLIEPFRPITDMVLWSGYGSKKIELNHETKAELAALTALPVHTTDGASPLSLTAAKICQSFARYCLGERDDFDMPMLATSLEFS